MNVNTIKEVLEATISPDQNRLQSALKFLEDATIQNFPVFVDILSQLLVDASQSAIVRQAAGIQLKNCLVAKDAGLKANYHERWFAIPEEGRNVIKNRVFSTLGTETYKPSSAAQCVAGIASAELIHNQWPQLMEQLCNNAQPGEPPNVNQDSVREATLETIGYICQDIDASLLEQYSAVILRAIVHSMGDKEQNNNIRFAATNAFLNSLEFIRQNFEKQDDRNFIMSVLCHATQATDKKVKVAALQSLVKIVSLYYDYMEAYMSQALFAISFNAMKNTEDDEIVLQGIEFWSSVCDEEIDLAIEAAEAEENGTKPSSYSRYYAKGALQLIMPVLLETLTKQEEHDDDEDWTPHKAAGVCLMLLASCCTNDVVSHVMPFVEPRIVSPDWKQRDAAVMAFGSILEGPDSEVLQPFAQKGMPYLLNLMRDQNMGVRDSVAWAMSRVCDQIPEAALDPANIENLLNALIENLDCEPRVATNVCWAFASLAEAAYENAQPTSEEDEEPATYALSDKFELVVTKIIQTGDRGDAHLNNLRSSAYEAVMELVKNSPKDTYATVQKTVMAILGKMDTILTLEESGNHLGDHSQHNDFKSLLCAGLQATVRKLQPADALKCADLSMTQLLKMLKVNDPNGIKTVVGGVQEDAFMAVGTLVECIGAEFFKYLEFLNAPLMQGLKDKAEHQVCISAIGVVGDLCRAIGGQMAIISDSIMEALIQNLADQTVHRSVKPHILATFGDVALAVGCNFKKYSEIVLQCLQQASQAQVDKSDYDMIDYLNDLRDACLEAYTGIIQGLKGEDERNVSPDVLAVEGHLAHILEFINVISQDPDRTDSLVGASCGLLGDIATAFVGKNLPNADPNFSQNILKALDTENFSELLQEGRRSKVNKTKTLAVWASKTIRGLKKL